jgi:hypothetical protein
VCSSDPSLSLPHASHGSLSCWSLAFASDLQHDFVLAEFSSAHCYGLLYSFTCIATFVLAQVKLVMRFLSDTSLSGGSWLWACPTPSTHLTHTPRNHDNSTTQRAHNAHTTPLEVPSHSQPASRQGRPLSAGGGLFEVVPPRSSNRRSSCGLEVVCSWRCLHSLTPDATQLAQHDWQPPVRAFVLVCSCAVCTVRVDVPNLDSGGCGGVGCPAKCLHSLLTSLSCLFAGFNHEDVEALCGSGLAAL